MKKIHDRAEKRTLGLICVLMVNLLFGSAIARADVVLDWNTIAVNTAVANKANPFAQARFAAIVQVAVFEAVNSVTEHYQPYTGLVTRRPGASAEAAAIQAAYEVLSFYFSASQSDLTNAYQISMGAVSEPGKVDGMAAGHEAAQTMIALRMSDGASSTPSTKVPGPPVPGEWQATPSCPTNPNGIQVGIAYQWQNVTPFGISRASDYLLPPPPALTSDRYADTYNEVWAVGSKTSTLRPPDRANVVLFFAASSPTQAFNQAARQVAQQQRRSLSENARALALVNMAINDSLIAAFFNKYHYNFWRPETAIHNGDADGNPDTKPDLSFVPFIPTPCFPSYPSNHGSASNAAAEVLRHLYGEGGHAITLSNPAVPTIVLNYTSFKQITDDVSDARVYGGIHFRTDQDAGGHLGNAVGKAIYKNNLRPRDE